MAEKTTPRSKRRASQDAVTTDQSAIEKARADFLRGAAKRTRRTAPGNPSAAATPKREPREPVTPVPTRRPDIAQRSAGDGQAFVDAMTAPTKERGYRSWAELDVEEIRGLSDEHARADAIRHLATNMRDPAYAEALRGIDPELAKTAMETVSDVGAHAPQGEQTSIEAGTQEAKRPVTQETEVLPSAANDPRLPLEERVVANDASARDAGRPEHAANDARVALTDRAVANDPQSFRDFSVDQPTLDRLAAQRARDLAAAQESIAQPSAGSPISLRRAKTADASEANGIEPVVARDVDGRVPSDRREGSTPVLERDGYDIPAAILSRYVVKDGKYWQFDGRDKTPDTTGEPHFEDKGARLATPSDDRKTIADMIAVAQAKSWKEITLNGSEEFRRNAWIEASLAGIEAKGFKPQERDEAMLEAARRERETLNISAGKRDPKASDAEKTSPTTNELAARDVVRDVAHKDAQGSAQPGPEKTAATVPVGELRLQAERAIAQLPENVRREVMNRFAERAAGGMTAEREHVRTGASRESLGPALDSRLAKIDQERVARQTPPAATQNAPGRGRGVSDKDVPDVSR